MKKLEAKYLNLNVHTLCELLYYYIDKNDLSNVIDTLNQFNDNGIDCQNRHILNAMIQLSEYELSDYKILLPYLVSNEEFDRELAKLIPDFVSSGKAELLPHILEAIYLNIDKHIKYMFTEMVRENRPAAEYNRIWFQLEQINFRVQTNLDAYKPALKCESSALILEILLTMHSDPNETLDETCFEQLMKLAAEENTAKMNDVIDLMCTQYRIRPRLGFIVSAIIPLLRSKQFEYLNILQWLRKTKIRFVDCIAACIQCALKENDMQMAFLIATKYSAYLADKTITIPLLNAYLATKDVDGFVRLLRTIVDSITTTNLFHLRRASTQITQSDVIAEQEKFVEQIIRKTILAQRSDEPENLRFLQTLFREGFSISSRNSRSILKLINASADSDIDKALKELQTKRSAPLIGDIK